MRTYTTMPTGTSARLLATSAGTTCTIATVPDPTTAAELAIQLGHLARDLLVDAAKPGFPAALRTLGVRQAEVEPAPGTLAMSHLAQRPAPDGASWRSTGLDSVFHLGEALRHIDTLPAGPQRSVRAELANLLGQADGPVVTATITADGGLDADRLTLVVTGWFASASDEVLDGVIGDDFEPGYGTDQIAWDLEELTAPVMRHGFSVYVNRDQATAWLHTYRPHLLVS